MSIDEHKFEELMALVKDNNKMLHAMRRSAFLSGILKLVMYTLLIIVPLWFYLQYMAPALQQMLGLATKMQSAGSSAEQKMAEFQGMIKQFQDSIPGL